MLYRCTVMIIHLENATAIATLYYLYYYGPYITGYAVSSQGDLYVDTRIQRLCEDKQSSGVTAELGMRRGSNELEARSRHTRQRPVAQAPIRA